MAFVRASRTTIYQTVLCTLGLEERGKRMTGLMFNKSFVKVVCWLLSMLRPYYPSMFTLSMVYVDGDSGAGYSGHTLYPLLHNM